MLTGRVWPAHPHPYSGECLSSWLIRCAHANGMKVQTFCVRNFGHERQIWNRDVDRHAPEWLLATLSEKTATPLDAVVKTTMLLFEGRFFTKKHLSGQLRWVLPLSLYHRTFRNFGVQFCPQCLAEDSEPYFRLSWRLAFYTFCPKHHILMHDRCHSCKMPVSYHRAELGKANQMEGEPMDHCWYCGFKLSEAPRVSMVQERCPAFEQWNELLAMVDQQLTDSGVFHYRRMLLLHQLCRLIVSESLAPDLQSYVCELTGQPVLDLVKSRMAFEHRAIEERHYVVGLALWLSDTDAEQKLTTAIQKRKLPSNQVYRDLRDVERASLQLFLTLPVSKRGGKPL